VPVTFAPPMTWETCWPPCCEALLCRAAPRL